MISADKEACISDVVSHQEGDDVRFWNLRFYRDFEDWELAASFSLLDFIQAHLPRGVGSDFLCWGLNGNGKFDTCSFYNELRATPNSSSLGRAFGKQRFPKGWLFFYGWQLMIAFLHWIILCLEVTLWQINVVCVGAVGNLWIISLFTVMWRILYGFLCFKLLIFNGS